MCGGWPAADWLGLEWSCLATCVPVHVCTAEIHRPCSTLCNVYLFPLSPFLLPFPPTVHSEANARRIHIVEQCFGSSGTVRYMQREGRREGERERKGEGKGELRVHVHVHVHTCISIVRMRFPPEDGPLSICLYTCTCTLYMYVYMYMYIHVCAYCSP